MGLSISVFGMGYVGSVSAACFAHVGHKVIGVDVSPLKVEMMAAGRTPIIEARMSEGPVVVSGADGRAALAVALRIMRSIDASLLGAGEGTDLRAGSGIGGGGVAGGLAGLRAAGA